MRSSGNPEVKLPRGFPDFLESLLSRLAKAQSKVPELFDRAPLFFLGRWDEIVESITELGADWVENLADGLMDAIPYHHGRLRGKTPEPIWCCDKIMGRDQRCHSQLQVVTSRSTPSARYFRKA
jgi:hypothetical protein